MMFIKKNWLIFVVVSVVMVGIAYYLDSIASKIPPPKIEAEFRQIVENLVENNTDTVLSVLSDGSSSTLRTYDDYPGCFRGQVTKLYGSTLSFEDNVQKYKTIAQSMNLEVENSVDGVTLTDDKVNVYISLLAANSTDISPAERAKYHAVYFVQLIYAHPKMAMCYG